MSDDYLLGKFRALAAEALPKQDVERLREIVWSLDEAATLEPLCQLMATVPGAD